MNGFDEYECAVLYGLLHEIWYSNRKGDYKFRPLDAEQKKLLERLMDKLLEE